MRALVKLIIISKHMHEDPQAVPRHMTDSNAKLKMQQHHTSGPRMGHSRVYLLMKLSNSKQDKTICVGLIRVLLSVPSLCINLNLMREEGLFPRQKIVGGLKSHLVTTKLVYL